MLLLREVIGSNLRAHREHQRRSLRDVSASARVSLGYLSEIERGRKEASSELLASICDALELPLADLLSDASTDLRHRDFVSVGAGEVPADEVIDVDDLDEELSAHAAELKLIFGQDERETVGV